MPTAVGWFPEIDVALVDPAMACTARAYAPNVTVSPHAAPPAATASAAMPVPGVAVSYYPAPGPDVAGNSILNPGFATGLSNWGVGGLVTWDGTTGHTANGSLKIQANGTWNNYAYAGNFAYIPVAPGQVLNLSLWMKQSGAASSIPGDRLCFAIVETFDASFNHVDWPMIVGSTNTADIASFQRFNTGILGSSDPYLVPAGVAYVQVYIQTKDTTTAGTYWIDDVSLTINDPVPQATARAEVPDISVSEGVLGAQMGCTSAFPTPTVSVGMSLSAPAMGATSAEPVPAEAGIVARMTPPAATATAAMPTPTTSNNEALTAPVATATAQAQLPTRAINYPVTPPAMTATAQMPLPGVALNTPVAVPVTTATALFQPPIVTKVNPKVLVLSDSIDRAATQ